MVVKISELMDNLADAAISADEAQNDSTERVKELTRRKIMELRRENRHAVRLRRRMTSVLIAAALILALGVGAYAISRSWSHSMDKSYENASEEEKKEAEESGLITSGGLASDTVNGVTISVEDMSSDGGRVFAVLRVEGLSYPDDMKATGKTGNGAPKAICPEMNCVVNKTPMTEASCVFAEYFEETESYVAPDGSLEMILRLDEYNGGEINVVIDRICYSDLRLDAETYNSMLNALPVLAEGPWELSWTPEKSEEMRVVLMKVPFHEDTEDVIHLVLYPSSITFFGNNKELASLENNNHLIYERVVEKLVGARLKDGTIKSFQSSECRGWENGDDYGFNFGLTGIIEPEQVEALLFTDSVSQTSVACVVEDSDVVYLAAEPPAEENYGAGTGQLKMAQWMTEETEHVDLSDFSGYQAPEQQAIREWLVYADEYMREMDYSFYDGTSEWTARENYPEYWENGYQVFDEKMADKLEEIAAKYGLKLYADGMKPFETQKEMPKSDMFKSELAEKLFSADREFWGSCYDDGAFWCDFLVHQPFGGYRDIQVICNRKGMMPGASGWSYDWGYHELETPDKWEYVTKDGTKLLLLLKLPNELAAESPYAIPSGEILADLDGCFVGIYVWGVDFNISSREALEALADQIDFSVF